MREFIRVRVVHAALIGAVLLLALPAAAIPTTLVSSVNTPPCDALLPPLAVDEIGEAPAFAPFPDELIGATAAPIQLTVCPSLPNSPAPDAVVSITNLTALAGAPTAFSDLWYVADPETTLSNPDGLVNGMLAFKIDAVGINLPLIFESILVDGIFAPGETWDFVIQDFANGLGLPPDALGSIGVPSPGPTTPASSGSIIAIPIPEPASAALLGLGLLALSAARRRSGAR